MNPLGIMLGRLSSANASPQTFPSDWEGEFDRARSCGFERIEWLLTAADADSNPLLTSVGAVLAHVDRTGLPVSSLCAHYFIERPLIHDTGDGVSLLERLVGQCAAVGAEVIVLPILEGAAIRTSADHGALDRALRRPLARAEAAGVRIALESDVPAPQLRDLIESCASRALGVCYDTGNAAAAGDDVASDLAVLGPLLCAVHIKDRVRAGASTPLGNGAVDFTAVAAALMAAGYSGPLILETPPGDDPMASAMRNLSFARARLGASIAP